MRKCCLLPFLLLILIGSNAQDLSTQYRMVGKDDIGMTRYDKDPSAEAVVLHDYGKSSIVFRDQGFIVYYERTTRIKIFSEAGLRWANVEIPIYQEGGIYEKVFELEACTYNLTDGNLNRKQLDPENCHEEKLNEFWNVLKFAMPDVREGSVIEYKYTISSQYMFNLRDWEFQWRIPVVYSEYEVHMVPFYTYTWLLQGASKFDVYTSYIDKNLPKSYGQAGRYYDMIYKFGMRDMPAFRDEEFITSINDYIIKLDFQLSSVHDPYGSVYNIISTWPDMIEELLKHDDFGKYIKKSEKLANKLVDIDMISHMSPPERFNTIINYVKGNYNWNKINSKYAHKPVNDLLADKYGNNAEINLFLTGLLRAAGLEAYPVILSTREHGKIKYDYPFSHFFNYVLVWVKLGNGNVLADATDIMNANDRIPARCINDKGLIIKEGSVDWISLECNTSSEQNY